MRAARNGSKGAWRCWVTLPARSCRPPVSAPRWHSNRPPCSTTNRTDARFLPGALARYELRRKPRAETFQDDSRRLASMMMIESTELSWGRDQFYTLDMLAKNIAQSLAKPI
jgi:hypothetical protein